MKKIIFILLCVLSQVAQAQTSFGFYNGMVPTAGQWNYYFSYKQDFVTPGTINNVMVSNGSTWYSGIAPMPVPSPLTLGGLYSSAGAANQWLAFVDNTGTQHLSQPAFSNLSGSAACSQMPALTGAVTTSAGACATAITATGVTPGLYTLSNTTINAAGQVTAATSGVLQNYISGFGLSNDGTNPSTTLDIAAGEAADSANAIMMAGTAFTKLVSGTWAAGSGSNGMGSGLTVTSGTWYHVFAIINAGTYDVYFDTSATAANKSASTTAFRYIGSFYYNGGTLTAFKQYGQKFVWASAPADLNAGAASSITAVTLTVPLGFVTFPILNVSFSETTITGTGSIYASTTSATADCTLETTVSAKPLWSQCQTTTNTASQIAYNAGAGTGAMTINTVGYINPHVAPNF